MSHSYKTASPDRYLLLKSFADRMKKFPTEAEGLLWVYLRADKMGWRFRRQYIIGDYIADFVCLEKDLIIEVDGEYHFEEEQMISDEFRTLSFQKMGFRVIRFTNDEVIDNQEWVIDEIYKELEKQ